MARVFLLITAVALIGSANAQGRTLYETSFDTADAVTTWRVVSGTWEHDATAGTYTCSGTNELLTVYEGPLASDEPVGTLKDYVVTAELSKNNTAGGIVARYKDLSNYYYLRHHADSGQLQLWRIASAGKVNIAFANFATASLPETFILNLDMVGSLLMGTLLDAEGNELAAVRIEDTAFTSGPAGLRNWSGTQTFHSFVLAQIQEARFPTPPDAAFGVVSPLFQWTAGAGALLHSVYIGTSPELTAADLVSSRLPLTMYWHGPGLQPGVTYYWRVDEVETDMTTVHPGNVWSFVTQALTAYYPNPEDGAVTVSPAPTLAWLPGKNAVKHRLYFGDNLEAVSQGAADTDKGEWLDTTYAPEGLQEATSYYWRVDELLADGSVQTGAVWSFTTFLLAEDFESYTDDEGSRIYETWLDGWVNDTGSTVGNLEAPFAEQTIVRSGLQSMPLDYNNANSPFYSETERQFAPARDWTVNGVNTLTLYIRGQASNAAGRLYVLLEDGAGNSAAVSYAGETLTTSATWVEWRIPLSQFTGVDPTEIKKMHIGAGDRVNPTPGGAGRIYVDDIQITRAAD